MKKFIKIGLILTGALALFILSGCSSKEENLDISNCIENRLSGFDGYAKFDGKVDYKKLMQIPTFQNKLTPEMLKGDYKIKLVADKTTDLKNGDKVKLSLDYNKEIYKRDFGVELTFEPKEFEVKGLKKFVEKKDDLTAEQWKEVEKESEQFIQESKILKNNQNIKLSKVVIYTEKSNMYDEITLYYKLNNDDKEYLQVNGVFSKKIDNSNLIGFSGIGKVYDKEMNEEIDKGNKSTVGKQEVINY